MTSPVRLSRCALVLALLGVSSQGQGIRLSRHLPRVEQGSVGLFAVSGERVIFSTSTGVFTTRLDGTTRAVRVSTLLPSGSSDSHISAIWGTPDGDHVLILRSEGDFQREFVKTPIDREEPVVLADLFQDPEVVGFTPDSNWFIYRTDDDLWSLPLDGSSAPILLHSWQSWVDVKVGTDSRHIIAVTGSPVEDWRLLSLAVDGSRAPINLAPLFTNISSVTDVTPDGESICFTAGRFGFGNLLRVAVDGSSTPVLLSTTDYGDVSHGALLAGDRVVYQVRGTLAFQYDLHSVPIDGSEDPVFVAADVDSDAQLRLTPDATGLVFSRPTSHPRPLVWARIDGSVPAVTLGVNAEEFSIDPTGEHLVFNSSSTFGVAAFSAVRLDGSGPPFALPTGPTPALFHTHAFDSVGRLLYWSGTGIPHVAALALDASAVPQALDLASPISPSNWTMIEAAGQRGLTLVRERDDGYSLRSAPFDGSEGHDLSAGALTTAMGSVSFFDLSPSGTWAVYSGDVRFGGREELFSTNRSEHHRLSPTLEPDEDVLSFSITQDSEYVVYTVARSSQDAVLFGVPMRRQTEPVRLSPVGFSVGQYWCAPDGATVLFNGSTSSVPQSFLVKVDGSGLTPLPRVVQDLHFSPDGDWAAFGTLQLWVMPVDLHTAPVQLDSSTQRDAFTPDGSRVLWVNPTFFPPSSPHILRSSLVDGSGPIVDLSLPGSSPSDTIGTYLVTADSQRVVFTHNVGSTSHRLFVNNVAGGTPIDLHPGNTGGVQIIALSDVRQSVLYSIQFSLFEVSLSGTQAPRSLLSGAAVNSFDFNLSPDESTVFLTGRIDGVDGIHRFSLDAPDSAVLLAPGSGYRSLELLPDGLHAVVYKSDNYGRAELYSLGTTTPGTPRRISGELAAIGKVTGFEVGPLGKHLIYRAAQRTSGNYELYVHFMEGLDPQAESPRPGASVSVTVP